MSFLINSFFTPYSASSQIYHHNLMRIASHFSLIFLCTYSFFACESLQTLLSEECTFRSEQYQQILAVEGALHEEIPNQAPYPMALIFSQDTLNNMLQEVSDTIIDPIEIGIVKIIPTIPVIQIEQVDDCETCIVIAVSFDLEIDAIIDTLTATGKAQYQFPIRMQPQSDQTQVFADFNQSQFQELSLSTGQAFIDEALAVVEDQLTAYINGQLADYLGSVELFSMNAWQLGDGAIKILPSGPLLSAETKTLMLGLHTNLVQPLSQSVALDPILPTGADVGLQMHPELLQVILQRMLHEGVINRSYNEDGSRAEGEESSSALDLTLSSIQTSQNNAQALDLGFTLWRTEGLLCGSVELHADLMMSVGEQGVALDVGDISLENGQGSFGLIASQVDDWIQSDFMKEIVDLSTLTLNYNELEIAQQQNIQMQAQDLNVQLDGAGFNIYFSLTNMSK